MLHLLPVPQSPMETNTQAKKQSTLKNFFKQLFNKDEDLREELSEFFKEQETTINNDQLQMMLNIVELIGYDADKIKIPANKMVDLPMTATLKQAITIITKSGHSRIPVYKENKDNKCYTGVLYAKDLLPALVTKAGRFKMADYIRKMHVVPESQSVLSLLREMRLKKNHLALTVTEHGDFSGLITLEDILEEIVGDIKDEFDSGKSQIKEVEHRLYQVDASLPLSDINKQLAINLPEEKFNTLAGFLLHELKGELEDHAMIMYGQITITLLRFSDQQIKTATIKIPPKVE